ERALLRAWVAAGAKDDASTLKAIPDIRPRKPAAAAVAAIAYAPDGKHLAAGTHGEVVFIEAANGTVVHQLAGMCGKVTALRYSRNGRSLAVASGREGNAGEVRVYAILTSGLPADRPAHV